MRDEIYSIVERLAILEGRITPNEHTITESKQKKPALFNNLKKDESAIPMVGGVEFAEDTMEEDVLGKVKASFTDYLQGLEKEINQDKDLLAKKKQDLDLKKKELKDLDLQTKRPKEVEEAIPDSLEENQLAVGDPIIVIGPNQFEGKTGEIVEFSPSGKFIVVNLYNHGEYSMHLSDVEYNKYADDDYEEVDEDPNQTPAGGEAPAGLTDPTYAESAPVKSMNFPLEEMGGSVLVEIHGDERNGFRIRRAGKELNTRFKSLEECEIALEMFAARRREKAKAAGTADYIEER